MRSVASILFPALAIIAVPGMALAQERQGEHSMTGEIVAIDKDTGATVVSTESIPLSIHFPKDQVQDLKTGDTITVHLSFEKGQKQ